MGGSDVLDGVDDRTAADRQITAELNQVCRRLREYESEEQWLAALRDGISLGARSFGVFALKDGLLRLRSEQNLGLPGAIEFPVSSASGFAAAIEGRDPLVTLRTRREVGEFLSGPELTARARIFPIVNAGRVVAIVFTTDEKVLDASVIELIAGVAGAALERPSNRGLHAQIGSVPQKPKPPEVQRSLSSWADLPEQERVLHSRAQRFARVAVAQMELARPEACQAGRDKSNLYFLLRDEIDKARENYARQFMTLSSMVDYLHRELVERLADDDEGKLGAEYPGKLV